MCNDSIFADDLIHAYTREQAIADGTLVDVTAAAREAGFRLPVALTATLNADVSDLSGKYVSAGQDAAGRLWDLLTLARLYAASPANASASAFLFELYMPVGDKKKYRAKAVISPGDDGKPVITLLRPEED